MVWPCNQRFQFGKNSAAGYGAGWKGKRQTEKNMGCGLERVDGDERGTTSEGSYRKGAMETASLVRLIGAPMASQATGE